MKNPFRMKNALYRLLVAASLPVIVQTVSAQTNVLLTDNFTVTANSNDPNSEIATGRQGGLDAVSLYTSYGGLFGDTGDQHQVGNTTTDVGQPGGMANSNIVLLYQGAFANNIDLAATTNSVGPLTVSFDMYTSGNPNGSGPTSWGAFSVTAAQPTPLGDSGGFGFLQQINGGLTLFQNNGNNITPSGWGNAGFATNSHWSLTFSDTTGFGSAFNGHGSKITFVNGTTTLGTVTVNQLNSSNVHPGFSTFGSMVVGIDNLSITATPPPSVVPPSFVTNIEPVRTEVTTGAPLTLSVAVNGTSPQYQWSSQSGPISGATGSSYTFNAVAGTSTYFVTVTNSAGSITSSNAVVVSAANMVTVKNFSFENDYVANPGGNVTTDPMSWTSFNEHSGGDMGSGRAGGSDYTVNNPLAPTADGNQYAYVNVFSGNPTGGLFQDVGALQPNTIYTLTVAIGQRADPGPGGSWSPGIISLVNGTNNTGAVLTTGGGLPSTPNTWQDYTVTFSTGGTVSGDLTIMLSVVGASSIQADFDNVRLTEATSPVTLPSLVTNTTPASATVAVGSNVVFTASYGISPPVNLQWQQIVSGSPNVTNNINTGVVTVTNSGVITSTLTLNNVQLSNAGSYQLEAINATNAGGIVYSLPAPLTVIPTITWYAAGTYNSTFTNDAVLALAGSTGNEVYGVNFGVGAVTTANGYTFDDYAGTGNMSIVATGLNSYGGYLVGGATTGDGSLDIMLANGVLGSSVNTGTLNNLTVGQTYTVLVLLDDTRSSGAGGPSFDVTDGITTSPAQRYAFANGVPAVGGYIMGTFTARGTTQPLTVLQNGNAQYNAILLETGIAPPPPIPPTLVTDIKPVLAEVTTGQALTMSVAAQGTQPLQYQWFNQNGAISGATSSNLTINAVNGTNFYYVSITNTFGAILSSTNEIISAPNIVTVKNFSFENQVLSPGGVLGEAAPSSWTGFNTGGSGSLGNGFDWGITYASGADFTDPLTAPASGNNYLWVNRWNGNGTQVAGVYQDVGSLQPNTTYTLTVAIGQRANTGPNGSWSPGIISLVNGADNTGAVLATGGGLPATPNTWQNYTATITTGASVSGDLTVVLSALDAPSIQAAFDNVQLTKAAAFQFGTVKDSGGNLILTATGGTPNGGYTLLSTTNLAAPINWTTNSTGTLDGSGAYSNSIPISTNPPVMFFKLRTP